MGFNFSGSTVTVTVTAGADPGFCFGGGQKILAKSTNFITFGSKKCHQILGINIRIH